MAATAGVLVAMTACEESKPAAPANAQKSRVVTGKYTQEVMNLEDAKAQGGLLVTGKGTVGPTGDSAGYLGAIAEARRSAVATIANAAVKQAVAIYDIQNNGPVKTYDEFMQNIIKKGQPDGIQLPMLPYYQEYAFDVDSKELVVVEFPKRKEEFEKQNP